MARTRHERENTVGSSNDNDNNHDIDIESDNDVSMSDVEKEDEKEDDAKSKVEVKIGNVITLSRVLRGLKKRKKNGKVLQLNVDPNHRFSTVTLKNFLLKVIAALPLVQKLEISTDHSIFPALVRNANWPLSLVTVMLEKFKLLKRDIIWVRLCFLNLSGKWQDYNELAETLQGMNRLVKFNFDKISVAELPGGPLPTHPGCWLDPIIQSLAKLPRILHVRVLGTRDFQPPPGAQGADKLVILQNSTLRLLCQSKSMRSLCLIHFNLTDSNVTEMATTLLSNKAMQELDIDCTLEKRGCYALAKLMESKTVLEDLNLCVRCKTDESEEERITNSTGAGGLNAQQKESLAGEDHINETLCRGVGDSSLINFALFRGRISSKSQDSFRDMISTQYNLESLTLYTGDENLNKALAEDPIIAFYARVNYFGRRQFLLNQPPVGRWKCAKDAKIAIKKGGVGKREPQKRKPKPRHVPAPVQFAPDHCLVEALVRVKDDLSCLYYFLNSKPSICERALEKMNQEDSDGYRQKYKRAAPASSDGEPPNKRTRLYRSAKYKRVCYKT